MRRRPAVGAVGAEQAEGFDVHAVARILRRVARQWAVPVVGVVAEESEGDPFLVLVSCLLSLRTRDETTAGASERLFKLARTPERMARLPLAALRRAIYPVSFYRTKARVLVGICRDLLERFGGKTPDDLDALLSLKGVGRKTANLVVTVGFGKPGICVDTHVHRICNRLGYVKTRTPEKTEEALRRILPRRYWVRWNDWLVPYGQHLCTPLSPFCSRCELAPHCARVGVTRSR
ncbi:MAG: endonuclease III [Planctomycetes bacterium]|nr:endonuclease III [Planctomycetota bacterium]